MANNQEMLSVIVLESQWHMKTSYEKWNFILSGGDITSKGIKIGEEKKSYFLCVNQKYAHST